jgi:magnesium-transporting ATPase (P-type)
LRALLRRLRPQASNLLRFEDLELDLVSRQAKRGGKIIDLTNREFALLEVLMMTAPRPVSKAVIIERVWNRRRIINPIAEKSNRVTGRFQCRVLQVCHEMNGEGLRVLAVAYKNFTVDQANYQYRVNDESDLVPAVA